MGSLKSLLYMLTILASFAQLNVSVTSQCLEEQHLKLIQLKESLHVFDATYSTKLTTWNSSTDCCIWHGVTCNIGGLVVGLDLSDESINGSLDNSSSLFELQYLESLNLASNSFKGQIPSGFGKLINLRYLNLSDAGFKGQIPIEISQLTRLVTLDLSARIFFSPKLDNPNLLTLVRNLTMLKGLYLDGFDVGKDWSRVISYSLPNLRVLSLSNCNLSGPIDPSLENLQFLSELHLDLNNFVAPVPQFFANLSNLFVLNLQFSELIGSFPETIFQLPLLEVLDLSGNEGLHGYIPQFRQNLSLNTLLLSWANFSGILPDTIGNLVKLSRMELAGCNFEGKIPSSITNLTELVYLDFSGNMFSGPLPSLYLKDLTHLDFSDNLLSSEIPSSHLEGLLNLSFVDLRFNSFTGKIPPSLFAIPSLQEIHLSFNQFGGQIPDFSNESSLSLNTLDLSSNQLEGSVPSSVFDLSRLQTLSLSSNKLNGSIQLDWILQLGNLTFLDLSHNNLTVKLSPRNSISFSFPQMWTLKLASCNLNQFPDLGNQSNLYYLDLSDNHIRGVVPPWVEVLSNKSLRHLNLSSNLLVHIPQPLSFPNLQILDVHDNQLQGNVPLLPPSVSYADYSNNNFTSSMPLEIGSNLGLLRFFSVANNNLEGIFPAAICNATLLKVLDFSNNGFNGTIPECIAENMTHLGVLNLRRNNFSGMIPDKFQAACKIEALNLENNLLEGMVPRSLANCTTLEVLDMGNNQINDKFPCLLKNISSLRVFILRQNKFRGGLECPEVHGDWPRLQILDLASNQFSGCLPHSWLTTWNAMMGDLNETHDHIEFMYQVGSLYNRATSPLEMHYPDSIAVTGKGLQMYLDKILTIFTSIDLSSNNFEGPIPENMGQLSALYFLNLSHNAFTGMIPLSLGNLSQLESLDLSNNQLTGNIPQQLAGLTFLSFLNLSNNRLVGSIPEGTQLQSFPPSSYQGNEELYGPPLTETCSDSNAVRRLCKLPPSHTSGNENSGHSSSGSQIGWNFIAAEVGYVFGLGVIFVPLMLSKRRRIWYNGQVDCIIFKVFPSLEAKSRNRTIRSPRIARRRRQ